MIKLTGSIQFYIFLLLYVSRRKFTYRFLGEKNSRDDTFLAKNVYWICALNLNLRLWNQH